MRVSALILILSSAVSTSALAAGEAQTCTKGDDTRVIEVLTPGKVGKACDLRVIRDNGASLSTPYHANNSDAFCRTQARGVVADLVADGFVCVAGAATAAVEAPGPSVAEAAEAAPLQADLAMTATEEAPEQSKAAESIESLIMEAEASKAAEPAEAPAAPDQTAPTPSPVAAAPAEAAAPVSTATETTLTAPPAVEHATTPEVAPLKVASGGPVALAPINASAPSGVRAPRTAAGRLVGATHDAKPLDIAPAVEERLAPAPTVVAATQETPAPAAQTTQKADPPKPRAAEDIIKSVLAAQTAAWNEGDLEAFMGHYWKDAKLRFVSGSTVSRGWKETMKHYRERYGEGAAMGRLSLDRLDVDLVTDDVATVIGRYKVESANGSDAGAFTLVMKRFDGLWRIVHDHSVSDAPRTN